MYIFVYVVDVLFYNATLSRQIDVASTDCLKGANITITSVASFFHFCLRCLFIFGNKTEKMN